MIILPTVRYGRTTKTSCQLAVAKLPNKNDRIGLMSFPDVISKKVVKELINDPSATPARIKVLV